MRERAVLSLLLNPSLGRSKGSLSTCTYCLVGIARRQGSLIWSPSSIYSSPSTLAWRVSQLYRTFEFLFLTPHFPTGKHLRQRPVALLFHHYCGSTVMPFWFADHRRCGSLNGDMSSVPLSDSGLYAGFRGGHDHHHDLSKLDGNAHELDAVAMEVTKEKEGDRGEKAATALKNHSEAERRRRERINAHLATLRSMVPCTTDKMDKAAVLAEVIAHVKKLKTNAARISSQCPVPADADEVTVELVRHDASSSSSHGSGGGCLVVKATMSCDDGADLFVDVKNALRPLRLNVVGSEVTTLGGRVRLTLFLMAACGGGDDDVSVVDSVRQALQSVLDNANSALEFAPRASLLNKRRRVSTFDSSSSSS